MEADNEADDPLGDTTADLVRHHGAGSLLFAVARVLKRRWHELRIEGHGESARCALRASKVCEEHAEHLRHNDV